VFECIHCFDYDVLSHSLFLIELLCQIAFRYPPDGPKVPKCWDKALERKLFFDALYMIKRTSLAGVSVENEPNIVHSTLWNDHNFGLEVLKDVVIRGMRQIDLTEMTIRNECNHSMSSVELRKRNANGLIWSTTPNRLVKNCGIACIVSYPPWLERVDPYIYITKQCDEAVCLNVVTKVKTRTKVNTGGICAPVGQSFMIAAASRGDSGIFIGPVVGGLGARNITSDSSFANSIIKCNEARMRHDMCLVYNPFSLLHGEVQLSVKGDPVFNRNRNFFAEFFCVKPYAKSTVDILLLRVMLSTIFKMMVMKNSDFVTILMTCKLEIEKTMSMFPFAVDPYLFQMVPLENWFDSRCDNTSKIRNIRNWMGFTDLTGTEIIDSTAKVRSCIGGRGRNTVQTSHFFFDMAVKSFDVNVLDGKVFKNRPADRIITNEIRKACACYQGLEEPLVAAFDQIVDNVTAITASCESREEYMSNMEIWNAAQVALSHGVMSSNIANRIWLERCRYLAKKKNYFDLVVINVESKTAAVDDWHSYCSLMSEK